MRKEPKETLRYKSIMNTKKSNQTSDLVNDQVENKEEKFYKSKQPGYNSDIQRKFQKTHVQYCKCCDKTYSYRNYYRHKHTMKHKKKEAEYVKNVKSHILSEKKPDYIINSGDTKDSYVINKEQLFTKQIDVYTKEGDIIKLEVSINIKPIIMSNLRT